MIYNYLDMYTLTCVSCSYLWWLDLGACYALISFAIGEVILDSGVSIKDRLPNSAKAWLCATALPTFAGLPAFRISRLPAIIAVLASWTSAWGWVNIDLCTFISIYRDSYSVTLLHVDLWWLRCFVCDLNWWCAFYVICINLSIHVILWYIIIWICIHWLVCLVHTYDDWI